jgi:KaiC/GvpD/RAD55 family RecA-like ATPase
MTLPITDAQRLPVVEAQYVGSFLGENGKALWLMRSNLVNGETFADPTCRAAYEAIEQLRNSDAILTIPSVARLLMPRLPEIDSTVKAVHAYDYLKTLLENMRGLGATGVEDFLLIESALLEEQKKRDLRKVAALVEVLNAQGLSADRMADQLISAINQAVGKAGDASALYGKEATLVQMSEMQQEMRAHLGKPLFTLPPEWGLNKFISHLPAGFMGVIGGMPGDGKSSLAGQFAEHTARCGINVLYIHLEDPIKIVLMRSVCRLTGATMEELLRGDPYDRIGQAKAIRQSWKGEITYSYMAGAHISAVVNRISAWAKGLQQTSNNVNPNGVVIIDYLQKIGFDTRGNRTLAESYMSGVELLKNITERYGLFTFIVSQLTKADGERRYEGTSQLEKRCQIALDVIRPHIDDPEEILDVVVEGHPYPFRVVNLHGRSPVITLQIKKANQGQQGSSKIFFFAPWFFATTKKAYESLQQGIPFEPEIVQPWDASAHNRAKGKRAAYEQAMNTLMAEGEVE